MSKIPEFKFAIREDLKDCNISFVPDRGTPTSTGWDVRAAFKSRSGVILSPGELIKIPLGFRTFCPEGWWFELKPRSSTFAKKNLHCLYGTIDTSFEGELLLAAQWLPTNIGSAELGCKQISFGEALGQIIPVKRKEMLISEISNEEYDQLCKQRNSKRGTGGFGSTDKL